MRRVLSPAFFDRPALAVARDLLGKFLVRRTESGEVALKILETEAYFGYADKGSHAHRGRTARNAPMFGPPGIIYVYFTYGMHWMLNLVCDRDGFPAAVLIRALETPPSGERLDGPARLTKFLSIDRTLTGKALGAKSGLWVEDRGVRITGSAIARTPRIGIPGRGIWTTKPWRFVVSERARASGLGSEPARARTRRKR